MSPTWGRFGQMMNYSLLFLLGILGSYQVALYGHVDVPARNDQQRETATVCVLSVRAQCVCLVCVCVCVCVMCVCA